VLLVVLGAGASYDCDPDNPPPKKGRPDYLSARPPLADALVDRGDLTGSTLREIPELAASVLAGIIRSRLRRPNNSLERILDEVVAKKEVDERQQLAFLLYLQRLLGTCSIRALDEVDGDSNQMRLVQAVETWRGHRQEAVLYVTFNYDTLLEAAFAAVYGWKRQDMQSYLSWDQFKLFKLHGSWDWKQVTDLAHVDRAGIADLADDLMPLLLDRAAPAMRNLHRDAIYPAPMQLDPLSAWDRHTYQPSEGRRRLAIPALAMPLAAKSGSFVCPSRHEVVLRGNMPKVNHILTIGWKGGEPSFLDMLGSVQAGTDLRVVDTDERMRVTLQELMRQHGAHLTDELRGPVPGPTTFSDFVAGQLEAYLHGID